MRTLFVGDLHAKADLLPLISRVAQRENTDRMVLLGDVCDDWNVSNNGLIRFFETFTSWYRREAGEREVIPLLGNHDVPYFLKQGSSSYARVRALAPGFKPGAHRKVHELMQNIPFQLAWSDGNILATHAGLTRAWGRRRLGCVCSIESGPCERVDVFHVSGRFWSTSACGEKRTPARPAWTSFPS